MMKKRTWNSLQNRGRLARIVSRRNGFSLVEVATVICVVVLVAALAFPALMKARDQSRISGCASNLRQVSVAMLLYAQEHSNRFPASLDSGVPWGTTLISGGYLNDPRIFKCPGDILNKTVPNEKNGQSQASSYAYCIPIMCGIGPSGGMVYDQSGQLNTLGLNTPSAYYMITEFHKATGAWNKPYQTCSWDLTVKTVSTTHPNGGRNAAFTDGHIEWRTLEQINNHAGWIPNNVK